MDKRITDLKKNGCEVEKTLERMLNDESFMLSCIKEVLASDLFNKLGEALKNKDVKTAFDSSHALKGILSNTGLLPLLNIDIKIVEPLRKGQIEGLDGFYKELIEERNKIKSIVGD